MESLLRIYFYALPVVLGASSLIEGLWLSRSTPSGYDWKAWVSSVVDLVGSRVARLLGVGSPHRCSAVLASTGCAPVDRQLDGAAALRRPGVLLLLVPPRRHTVRWFWGNHAVHHSPNELNLSAAYRLGSFGKLTGTTLFFMPLILLGFTLDIVLWLLSLNLLYQFWIHADLDSEARLARVRAQHAVGAPRAPRVQPRIPRCQLRRRADRLRSPVRHLHRGARRPALRLRPAPTPSRRTTSWPSTSSPGSAS